MPGILKRCAFVMVAAIFLCAVAAVKNGACEDEAQADEKPQDAP